MAAMPSTSYPAFSNVRADPKGRFWVQDFESQAGWTVFDQNGMLLGRFAVPGGGISRAGLVAVGDDWVALLSEDANGSPRIRLHQLHQLHQLINR